VPLPSGDPLVRRPEFDYALVVLHARTSGLPAGARGVIVDAFEDRAIVEFADRRGRTLDLLTLPYEVMTVYKHPESHEPDRVAV